MPRQRTAGDQWRNTEKATLWIPVGHVGSDHNIIRVYSFVHIFLDGHGHYVMVYVLSVSTMVGMTQQTHLGH